MARDCNRGVVAIDAERQLLTLVIDQRTLRPLNEARITPEFFQDTSNAEVYDLLLKHYSQYSEVAPLSVVHTEFPDWETDAPEAALDWYIDELRRAREYSIVLEGLSEARQKLKDRDTASAMSILGQALTKANTEVTNLRDIEVNTTWAEWWQDYVERPEGLLGIPTGFPTIDYATGGYQPEQLITLVATPKSGKSTAMLASAKHVNDVGMRPLFVSFEMSADEQRLRLAAMHARVNYQKLLHRKLSGREKRSVEKALRSLESMPDFILSTDISAGTTVAALGAKVEQYQPHVVFVDGIYHMDSGIPDVDQMNWRALTQLTRDFKRLAQRLTVPIVISTQVLESKYSSSRGLKSSDIGYSSGFIQDSDVVLGLERVEEDLSYRKLSIVAARNASPRAVMVHWDWSRSTFEETDEEILEDPYLHEV